MKLIVATSNEHKLKELREIFADIDAEVVSMSGAGVAADPEENGVTFEDNALIKAQAVYDEVAAKLPEEVSEICVISDDSGLEIDALNGEPGVQSARFMGHDTSYDIKNNAILDRLKDVPDEKRTARFVCAAAVVYPDGSHDIVRETMEGRIGYEIAGENGFGYDPIFFLPGYGMTSAEISPEEKNSISHRGKAMRKVANLLQKTVDKRH